MFHIKNVGFIGFLLQSGSGGLKWSGISSGKIWHYGGGCKRKSFILKY
jgi:hypothetical protein